MRDHGARPVSGCYILPITMRISGKGLPAGSFVILLAVAVGAWLRFTGIGWGLHHPAHSDEQAYIESVSAMLDAGDLDHRYYYYPGLFFYLLAPIVAALGEGKRHGPEAYLACRVFVAAVASFNVWIAGALARRLAGPWAGGAAALALAVSPLSSSVAHEVRPDLLLETLGLLAIALYARVWNRKEEMLAGGIVGTATAIKFSGLLFLAGSGIAAWLRRIPLTRVLALCAFAALIVIGSTPYAIVRLDAYFGGRSELDVYFQGLTFGRFAANFATYSRAAFSFGGIVGALVAAFGLLTQDADRRRTWWPWLTHFLLTLVVFSLASLAFPRHVLQVMAGLCVLFGLGIARVAVSSKPAAVVLMIAALVLPFRGALEAATVQATPSAPDRALAWIDANMKDGSVILETRREAAVGARAGSIVGVDRSRFEFVVPDDPVRSELLLLLPHADLAIVDADRSSAGSLFSGARVAFEALGGRGLPVLSLVFPGFSEHPSAVEPRSVGASTPTAIEALTDHRPASLWSSTAPMNGSEWIELRLPEPRTLCRVDVEMPLDARGHEPELAVKVAAALDSTLMDVRSARARSSRDDQVRFGRPRGQTLVFARITAQVMRIEQRGVRPDAWTVSEVRVFECGDGPGALR